MTDDPGFRPETHSTVESLLAPEVAEALATLAEAIKELRDAAEGWPTPNGYTGAADFAEPALALITRELERGARVREALALDRDTLRNDIAAAARQLPGNPERALRILLHRPEPDTDPHRCADPDGVGHSEMEGYCTCPAGGYDRPNAVHEDYCALAPQEEPRP